MVTPLQKIIWGAEEGNIPCWWGGFQPVKKGDEVWLYEGPTATFVHRVVGRKIVLRNMSRIADA